MCTAQTCKSQEAQLPSHKVPMQPVLHTSHMIRSPWPLLASSKSLTHVPSDGKRCSTSFNYVVAEVQSINGSLDYIKKYLLYFFNLRAICFSKATTEQLLTEKNERPCTLGTHGNKSRKCCQYAPTQTHIHTHAHAHVHTHTH